MRSFNKFTRDLTHDARQGRCEPAYGCDGGYPPIFEHLAKEQAGLVLLVGQEGVGKTRFLKGMALAGSKSPMDSAGGGLSFLRLDLESVATGIGDVEEPLRDLVAFMNDSPHLVLVVDDAAELLGLRPAPALVQKAGEILAPLIRSADLRCLATLTDTEYGTLRGADAPPADRTRVVPLQTFTRDRFLSMLTAYAPTLEKRHTVNIDDSALHALAVLPKQFTPDAATPDNLMDALDRACVRYNRKAAAAHANPELVKGTSLSTLGDRVGAYDVLRTIEESGGVDIQTAAINTKNRVAQRVAALLPGQRNAVTHLVNMMVNFRFGFSPPYGPAGILVLWGTEEASKRKVVEAAQQASVKEPGPICTVDLPRQTTFDEMRKNLDEALSGAVAKNPLNFLLFEHAETASAESAAALAEFITSASSDPAAPLYNVLVFIAYDTPVNGGRTLVLDHLQKAFPPRFAKQCGAMVQVTA